MFDVSIEPFPDDDDDDDDDGGAPMSVSFPVSKMFSGFRSRYVSQHERRRKK
jgi:hypothetical protein